MPIKEWSCTKCGSEEEGIIRSDKEAVCSKCGSTEVQFKLSFPGNYTIKGDNSASVRPKGGMKPSNR